MGDEYTPLDLSSFQPTGPNFALDAIHFARAVMAVMAAADTSDPAVQLEVFDGEGVLVIGTDRYSSLFAWVPWPDLDGWEATKRNGIERPADDVQPSLVLVARDVEGDLPRWVAKYGKASRAKERPREQVTIEVGTLTTPEPVLGDDVQPWAIRFGGESTQVILAYAPGGGYDWRPFTAEVDAAPPAEGAVKLAGQRVVQLGRLAGITEDRVINLQTRVLDNGSVVTVDVPGFPHVTGYAVAAR